MLSFLPAPVRLVIACLLLGLNVIFWVPVLLVFTALKLLIPVKSVRHVVMDPILLRIANTWIDGNSGWMRLVQKTRWDIEMADGLDPNGWYMVCANHQSWADIFVLQHVMRGRIPFLKFFLKQQLIWVPFMGVAWWALDFPFMRRHSEEYLKKHPEMRARDQETTRKACEKFAFIPTSVMNFLEGTRFTPEKHQRQQSPYRHLLKPKAGGIALALNAMGGKFHSILDVTIVYPEGKPTFIRFISGEVEHVVVRMRVLPIPTDLAGGDYLNDPQTRDAFSAWVKRLWQEKDEQIAGILSSRTWLTSAG